MPTVAVVGASGLVGGLVADELVVRGVDVVRIVRGRQGARHEGVRTLDHHDEAGADALADALVAAVAGCDLVVDAVGEAWRSRDGAPLARAGTTVVLDAARRVGVHLVDVSPDQTHARTVHSAHDGCVEAGISVVPGAGFQHLIGDTLAHLAGTATPNPRELHVAYTLPDRGALLAAASRGRRASAVVSLSAPMLALVGGRLREEALGEQRRLAWFPRPVGPAHAAAVPGSEVISVPHHLPGIDTVRTYMALSGGRSELLQFVGNAVRIAAVRDRVVRRVAGPGRAMEPARREATKWGCVAEANGDDGVARAWAYGHDPYRLTAVAAVVAAEVVLSGRTQPGVVTPSDLCPPGELLDLVSTRTDLRWSVARPDPGATWPARGAPPRP